MAPDSNKVVPVFGSWIAARDGDQRQGARNKQEVAGKAKGRDSNGRLAVHVQGRGLLRLMLSQGCFLKIVERDPADLVGLGP